MSAHTEGPWSAEFAEAYNVRDVAGGRIAIMTNLKGRHGLGGRRDGDEVAANARLIAAAPAMLSALQATSANLSSLIAAQHHDAVLMTEWRAAVDAAIALATGDDA